MKYRILVLLLSVSIFSLVSQEKQELSLYIPTDTEMSNFINMQNYLDKIDNGTIFITESDLFKLCNDYIGVERIQSFLFEMFLRNTKNIRIQKIVLKYLETNQSDSEFHILLKKLYNSKLKTYKRDGKNVLQYSYNGIEYDENIYLLKTTEISIFDNKLNVLIFNLDWNMIQIPKTTSVDIPLYLVYGGGSNSISLYFRKFIGVNDSDIESIIKSDVSIGKYLNWQTYNLPIDEGIIKRSGIDKYIISFGTGPDLIENTHSGTFRGYLYDKDTKTLYEICYYMNFYYNNISYNYRNRIYSYLLYFTLFAYLSN